MHIAATARPDVNLERATEWLLSRNTKIHTLNRYFMGKPTRNGLIFGYGTVDAPEIRRGISLLRKALQG
jgi:GntR family transcriptional regulator / MocR family aminotransferase